jgi:hypothetical protein
MSTDSLKGFFVCDKCRRDCRDGCDAVGLFGPQSCVFAYFPRKQRIGCLGPWCDVPCDLRKDASDLRMEQMVRLVKFLTVELNRYLIVNNTQKETHEVYSNMPDL